MWDWLNKLIGPAPELAMNAKPVEVAVEVDAPPPPRTERNDKRMHRLRLAIANGDTRPELQAELERRERRGA